MVPSRAPQTAAGAPSLLPARLLALSTLHILTTSTTFSAARPMALSVLTHVAQRYLELLGDAAKSSAEQAGRQEVNGWDVTGALEELDGKGAVSGLFNWCDDNAKQLARTVGEADEGGIQSARAEEVGRLAEFSKVLEHDSFVGLSRSPIAALSFVPLSAEEAQALDDAGESSPEGHVGAGAEDEDDHDEADEDAGSSSSSSSDSDTDSNPRSPVRRPLPPPPAAESKVVEGEEKDDCALLWRSKDVIPSHIPAHFPPLPSLEKQVDSARVVKRDVATAMLDDDVLPLPVIDHGPLSAGPWDHPIPYTRSQIAEIHPLTHLPALADSTNEMDYGWQMNDDVVMLGSKNDIPAARKRKRYTRTSSLSAFFDTVRHLGSQYTAPLPSLPANARRRQMASSIASDALASDTIFGCSTLPPLFRAPRRSAGWLPHPAPLVDNPAVADGGIRPFTTPLPSSVTIPVPHLGGIGAPIVPSATARWPLTISSLLHKLVYTIPQRDSQGNVSLAGVDPAVIGRLIRTGPPSALSEKGEALAYVVEPKNGDSEPRYLEWGFEWKSATPSESLPALHTSLPTSTSLGGGPHGFLVREIPAIPSFSSRKQVVAVAEGAKVSSKGKGREVGAGKVVIKLGGEAMSPR